MNLKRGRTEYYLVPSQVVARCLRISRPSERRKACWYSVYAEDIVRYKDEWRVFKTPKA